MPAFHRTSVQPVAIFRFSPTEGPAHFAEWLDARALPWRLVALDEGEPVPRDPRAFAGIGMMGGPMSANDDLPWNAPLQELLRRAVEAEVPVIGHCLGGQLLAKALGGTVMRARSTEIGWHEVDVTHASAAGAWFGGRTRFDAFQWHYDAFTPPPGAVQVLTNAHNPQQGYVVDERHIGFQCHIEMTRALVETWCASGGSELPPQSQGAVQSEAEIRRDVDARVAGLNALADDVYDRWSIGLRR